MSTNKSTGRRGFAAMDPEKRIAAAKKGGHASHQSGKAETSATRSARGFAAMDEEKRKQIAKRGGSTSRRNRIDWKEQVILL